jgi:NitT/TauT family transport system substrate-binding protein
VHVPKRLIVSSLVVIIAIGTWIGIQYGRKPESPPNMQLQKVHIAVMPYSFSGYTVFLANQKGYFKNQGLEVVLKSSYSNGAATISAIISGEAQIAACSETPFMKAVIEGAKIYAIATTVIADRHLGIVARKDKGIINPKDLNNKTIGVTVGSNGEYFLDMALRLNGLSAGNIKVVDIEPAQILEKLNSGEVDTRATWNPQKFKAQKALGENGVTFDANDLYSPFFVIVASQGYVKSNPEIIKKVLKALHAASMFIIQNPTESNEIVAKEIKADAKIIKEYAATYHFKLSLGQAFLTTLENQACWALGGKLKSTCETPDFLDSIYLDALEEIASENVTIIR